MSHLVAALCTVALCALGVVGSGCGAGGGATPAAASTVALPQAPVDKAQAVAYAHAVNLRSSDLPGMEVTKPESESPQHGEDAELAKCVGRESEQNQVLDMNSALFRARGNGQYATVQSDVTVFKSQADVKRDFAATQTAAGQACITQFLKRSLSGLRSSRLHSGAPAFTWSTTRIAGTQGSYAVRITVRLHVKRTAAPTHLYTDILVFAYGPAEIGLETFASPRPLPSATEARLLTSLLARAR